MSRRVVRLVMALVLAGGAFTIAGAEPAFASHTCTANAYPPGLTNGKPSSLGTLSCSQLGSMTVTVRVQLLDRSGVWETYASGSSGLNGTWVAHKTVASSCPGPTYYRTQTYGWSYAGGHIREATRTSDPVYLTC
jgi:hypothetical protein